MTPVSESLTYVFFYQKIKIKKKLIFFCIIFGSNYFQAIQTAVFYKKTASEMFKFNLFMFLDI